MHKLSIRRGLLARVTSIYTIGALLLSAGVVVTCYTVAQQRLLNQEENSALKLFESNAIKVRRELQLIADLAAVERDDAYGDLLTKEVSRIEGNTPHLLINPHNGDSERRGLLPIDQIPIELENTISQSQLAHYRFRAQNSEGELEIFYIIGVEFRETNARYYEIRSLEELDNTLASLMRNLSIVAVMTSLAGAAIGFYSARFALAPVSEVSKAAQAIAAGDFKTRLDLQVDPNLDILSQSFNEMVEALKTRIDRDERFASDVSHELRSPLMTLTASVEVLERRITSLPDVAKKAVLLLRQDLTRFERLVEDLLEISRMDAGHAQLELDDIGLAEFLVNVIAHSHIPEIQLEYDNAHENLRIRADKRRLAQIITNLINNAEKYGGGATAISFEPVEDLIRINVDDLGPGVPIEERRNIFDRFTRISADRSTDDTGAGLGLSLVAEHVRLHNGSVWVEDRPDGRSGARFVVELPMGEHHSVEEDMAI